MNRRPGTNKRAPNKPEALSAAMESEMSDLSVWFQAYLFCCGRGQVCSEKAVSIQSPRMKHSLGDMGGWVQHTVAAPGTKG